MTTPEIATVRRLQGARFRLRTLALIPTWRCDIACRHCLFSSSPRVRGLLPIEDAVRVIAEVSETTTCAEVVLSGGEPFQEFSYLVLVAEAVRQRGLAFRIVTNGSFGVRENAEAMLVQLQSVGLASVAISWDGFHSEFLNPDGVKRVIGICRSLAIPVRLTLVVSKSSRLDELLRALGDEAFELAMTQVKCLPVGRAAKAVKETELLPPAQWEVGRACRSDFDTLSVVHDGSVYPCCAVGGFTEGIKLGSVHKNAIADLLHKRDNDLPWSLLAARGPSALLEFASQEELKSVGLDSQLHDCVACNRIFASALGDMLLQRTRAALSAKVDALFGEELLKVRF